MGVDATRPERPGRGRRNPPQRGPHPRTEVPAREALRGDADGDLAVGAGEQPTRELAGARAEVAIDERFEDLGAARGVEARVAAAADAVVGRVVGRDFEAAARFGAEPADHLRVRAAGAPESAVAPQVPEREDVRVAGLRRAREAKWDDGIAEVRVDPLAGPRAGARQEARPGASAASAPVSTSRWARSWRAVFVVPSALQPGAAKIAPRRARQVVARVRSRPSAAHS